MKKTEKHFGRRLLSFVLTLVMLSTLIVPEVISFASKADVPTYSVDTSWYDSSASTFTLTTPGQLLGFFQLLANTTDFYGKTIKLADDIDLNPGWNGNLTVSGTTPSLPASAPNQIWTGDKRQNDSSTGRWFHGTFDGQGHTIKGIYSYYDNNVASSGIFGAFSQELAKYGTLKNVRIENSCLVHKGYVNDIISSGICTAFRGNASITNCYFDVDIAVLNKNDAAAYTGAISAGGGNGMNSVSATMQNIVYAGTVAICNNTGSAIRNGTTNGRLGLLFQNAGGVKLNATNVLNVGLAYSNLAANNTGNGLSNTGHDAGNITSTQVLGSWAANTTTRNGVGSKPDSNWSWYVPLATYAPKLAVGYERDTTWSYSASTLHINSVPQLLQFVYLINAGTESFSGKTIYLDCDLDVNPGWVATLTFSAGTGTGLSNSTGTVTLPSAAPTAWTNTMNSKNSSSADHPYPFKGTFDGQGHTISGIYYQRTSSVGVVCKNVGLLFNKLESGAQVKNHAVTNSFFSWSEGAGNGGIGVGGIIGAVTSGCSVTNVYSEVKVMLQSTAHPKAAVGGIAGWTAGNMTNCVYNGVIASTNGTGSTTYPTSSTQRHLGGVCGEAEGGTQTNCVGITTFAVKEPSVALATSDQSTTTGGANQAIAGHYGSDVGTQVRVLEGRQASAPEATGWTYVGGTLQSYVPDYIATTFFADDIVELVHIANDEPFANFDPDHGAGSSYLISSYADLVALKDLSATYDLTGKTFKLSADITANASLDATDTAKMFNEAPTNVWTPIANFKGTLDGNGHKITGLYSLITESSGSTFTKGGMFTATTGATIKNLLITNSFFGIVNTTQNGSENRIYGGLIGDASATTIQNVYLDAEVWFKSDVSRAFGGVVGKPSGTLTIENFVFNGTFGSMKLCGAYSSWIGGSTPTGLISGHGNSKTITLTNVLLCATVGVAASNYGTGGPFAVHWGNNNVTSTNVYLAKQTGAVSGWTYNSALASYIPTTVAASSPIGAYVARTRTNKGMSWLDSRDNGTYLISSAADLKAFNAFGVTNNCSGKTFKLTADIDLNPGWNAAVTVANDVATFPTAPTYVWSQIDNFYGVLDGQNHQISGLYRYATALGDSGSAGGMFLNLVGATVKNLIITNSFFAAERTSWGSQNQKFGGLARSIQGATKLENVFFNAEVWFKTDAHRTAGMVAAEVVNAGASLTMTNVVLAGRFGHVKNDMTIAASSGSSAKGVIAGNANSYTITLSEVLVMAEITLDAVKDTGTKLEKTAHYGNGGVTGLDTLYYGVQKSPVREWTYSDCIASYAPNDLQADYVVFVEDAPISQFSEKLKLGSSFIITSMQDLVNFETKINASSNKGAGYIFKLTNDVDLNPGWSATPENTTKSDAPALKFPTAPATIWKMPTFKGTFDGQNHYIAGLYRTENCATNWQVIGGFCDQLRENGTIKNTKFVNGLVILNSTNYNDNSVGGVAGQLGNNSDTSSAHLYLQNLYVDMGVYVGCPDWAGCEAGGLVGQAAKAYTIENCTFAGTVGLMWNDSTTFSGQTFRCPPASNSSSAGNQIIADYGGQSGSVISNVVLAGNVIRNTGSSAQTTNGGVAYGLGRSTRSGNTPTVTNALIGQFTTLSAAVAAEKVINENSPMYTYSDDLGFLVATPNYEMGLADLPDGTATTQSIQEFLNGAYNPGSIFTIATPGDLIYAAQLSQKGYTFAGYTLKLTANIDLNPGWNAKITVSGGAATIPAIPPVVFPGFKEFRGTLDGDNHTISGIAMYAIFTSQGNLGFVEYLYGNIVNVKFNNGLIFARLKDAIVNDSKIGGIAARIQSSSARLENLYVDLNVWYQSSAAQRIGGIAAKTENGAHLVNIKFVGVVGAMAFNEAVPSTSTGLSISQLVADGNWKSALYITNCTMAGTVYASADATNPTNTEISSNINATNVSGTGTATVTGSAYSNSTSPFSILPSAYGATADSKTANYESNTLTKVYYYQEITRAQFTNYINALKSAGYSEMQNYSIGDSVYYLLQNGVYTVYASRIPCNGYTGGEKHRARVYVEPYGADFNTTKAASAKSTLCTAQLWQLNVDNWYSKSSGGACYVMRLTDGRFLVVDSGFGSSYEADNIYKILYENNVRDGEPVIAGWFFTHCHTDHVGGFQRFTKEGHGTDVIIEAFYINFPSHEVGLASSETSGDGMALSDVNATRIMMTSYPDAKVYKVHSGMSFGFADATVTILYTHEDAGQSYWSGTTLYKNELYNGNDTTMMFQVKIGDEKILFTGDSYKGAENAVYYTFPASSYASKFVTVSHHSYEGLSKAFYQAVAPTVALWPMDVARFDQDGNPYDRTSDEFSFYYRYNHTHSGNRMWESANYFKSTTAVKEVIPAYENACLTLPYTAKTYSGGSKTINLSTAYNNKVANPDGAGGSGITINEWYDASADTLYISSRKDLFDFMKAAQKGYTFADKTVELTANISANPSWSYDSFVTDGFIGEIPEGLSIWKAIPNFKGTFEGNGYTIRNLYMEATVSGSNNIYGGFINTMYTGAVIQNLIIKNSAFVATFNTTQGTSSNRIGGFVGRILDAGGDDTAVLTNLYIDLDVYYISGGCAALAGLVGTAAQNTVSDVKHTAQFVIENVVYAGDLLCAGLNMQVGANITLVSGQHMYGPYAIIGLSTAPDSSEGSITREVTNTLHLGALTSVGNDSMYSGEALASGSLGLGSMTVVNSCGSAAAANINNPNGWVENATLGSLIPEAVNDMIGAAATPVKAQQSSAYVPAGQTAQVVDLRFVGILDGVLSASELGNYSEVGMVITTKQNGETKFSKELETTVVYESVWSGETLYEKDTAGGFLYAFTVKNIPVATNMEFYVTTYSVSSDTSRPMNERRVNSEQMKFVYNAGLQAAQD